MESDVTRESAYPGGSLSLIPGMNRKRIGVIGFDRVASIDIAAPLEAFASARSGDSAGCYDVVVIGISARTFVSEAGITFRADKTLATAPLLDTIIIPGGSGLHAADTTGQLSDWLTAQALHTRRFVSITTGVFALARSGLLDGRHATTHWRFAKDLAQRFPRISVNFAASFVKDGQFYSCATPAAAMEMTLGLIEEDFGSEAALAVAREFVIRLRPPGANGQLFHPSDYQMGATERLSELPGWIAAHLHEQMSVEVLAERACVCPRHFSRLFKTMFNSTPAEFVEQLRLSEARQRLGSARDSIERVAEVVGFKSADAFRRAFERRVGLSPSKYRAQHRLNGSPAAVASASSSSGN